jgi:hypothetical protein
MNIMPIRRSVLAMVRPAIMASIPAILLAASPGHAQGDAGLEVPVRMGDHADFGRVVFDLPKGAAFDVAIEGDRALVVLRGAGDLAQPAGVPRNMVSLRTGPNSVTLVLTPGARLHAWRIGDRLVLDAMDAAPTPNQARSAEPPPGTRRVAALTIPLAAATPPEPLPAPRPPPARVGSPPKVVRPSRDPISHALPAVPPLAMTRTGPAVTQPEAGLAKAPEAAPVAPVVRESLGAKDAPAVQDGLGPKEDGAPAHAAPPAETPAKKETLAISKPLVATPTPPAFVLKADADVGAAAFRRGPLGVVVLDRRIPIEAPPGLAGAVVELGAVSTMVHMPLTADQVLSLSRTPAGWAVAIATTTPERTMAPQPGDQGLVFTVPRAGRVVAVLDPLTGGTLLVGVSQAAGPAAAAPDGRRTPDYAVLPTWLGVAIEPLTDRIDLRASTPGFVLTGAPPAAAMPVAIRGRRFDIPDEPAEALMNRLQAQLASAAAAPPRARTKDRMAAAQTMVALGMGMEAQSLLQRVAADDPQAAADARVQALTGIAAVMAGRPDEAPGLDDPRLDEVSKRDASPRDPSLKDAPPDEARTGPPDEVTLWRGVRDRRRGLTTAATSRLSSQAPLVQAYPPTLRRVLWPDVAEAAVQAGVPIATDALPPFARAMQLERQGKAEEALAAYAALDAGSDRLDQVRAAARLIELRLAGGQIGPGKAADAMERLSFAWRGDAREAGMRIRAAELRAASGGWRAALDALRQTETQFPDQKPLIQARKTAAFQAMLDTQGGGMSPLDLVLLAAEYADCVPDGAAGATLAALLADKLLALDLPARAIPVLQGLMRGAQAGPVRAEFGHRLALLLLEAGDPAGAIAALQASAAPAIAPALSEARALVTAKALAAQGDLSGAVAALTEIGTAAADDLRATIMAKAGDVQGSLGALADLAAKLVPTEGPLSDAAQDVLMREASAAVRAPDPALLRTLERYAPRMTGARADVFRVLTAAPLAATSELPRAARELALARTIPQRLQVLGEK